MSRLRLFSLVFLAGLGLLSGMTLLTWVVTPAPPAFKGRVVPATPAADFSLTSAGGRRVRLSDFRGQVVLLYFGYTFCPDVCPATLSDLRNVMKTLGTQASSVQVLMVSVDPERDTPDRVDEYVKHFDPRFVGLSGSPDEIAAAAAAFDIYYAHEPGSAATGYLVTHTATVTLIDTDGRIRLLYPFGVPSADIAADVDQLLNP